MALEKQEILILTLSIVARFIAALKIDHKKENFKLLSLPMFFKWSLHIISCIILVLVFPEFINVIAELFPKFGFLGSTNLLVTCIIGFAGYDLIKIASKWGKELLVFLKTTLFNKLKTLFSPVKSK